MNERVKSKGSWWKTVPGVLTEIAGFIAAISGLIVALHQVGLFGGEDEQPPTPEPHPVTIDLLKQAPLADWETGVLSDSDEVTNIQNLDWQAADIGEGAGTAAYSEKELENRLSPLHLHTNPQREPKGTVSGYFPWIERLPRNAMFEAQIGFQHGAFITDGVTFIVIGHHLARNQDIPTLLHKEHKDYTGQLANLSIDLSQFSGKRFRLELRVDAGESVDRDWAAWVDPKITVSDDR